MPREPIKEQARRVLGADFFDGDEVLTFGNASPGKKPVILEGTCCEKHGWLGVVHGECPTCRDERRQSAHEKKLRAWERYRDLVSLTERVLPEFVRGCTTEEQILNASANAVRAAKNAIALLEAEQPKEKLP